jgi:Na+-driven multidrug efflux pump
MNSVSCVIVIIINQGLIKYGSDLHVGAYGIINRVIFLFAMIVMGMNQGMQPIVGYNFGAKQTERVSKVLKYTLILATGVMTLGFIISEFLPTMVAAAFTNDQTLNELASTGLRLVALCLPLVGIQLVSVNFFQSIGMARLSIFMSLTRQVIFLIPGLIIIPRFIGVDGIWYSFPIADLLACLVAVYMLMVEYKKIMLKHSL